MILSQAQRLHLHDLVEKIKFHDPKPPATVVITIP